MAKKARAVSKDQPAFERKTRPEFRVLYGFLLRVRIDDPLGDYSEQTGAQFG
ncbi:MAG: hypothetical protein ABFS86_08650 [Planctomycetota bacterium]